eukprot:Em0007g451a
MSKAAGVKPSWGQEHQQLVYDGVHVQDHSLLPLGRLACKTQATQSKANSTYRLSSACCQAQSGVSTEMHEALTNIVIVQSASQNFRMLDLDKCTDLHNPGTTLHFSRTTGANVESGLLQQGGVMNVERGTVCCYCLVMHKYSSRTNVYAWVYISLSGLVQQSANCKRTQASNVERVLVIYYFVELEAINCETTLRITVHRSTVWMDALREAQKQSFCASVLLKVTFFGKSSIDDGGPWREFFRLLVLQAGESLLRGDNIKFFSVNVPALVTILLKE